MEDTSEFYKIGSWVNLIIKAQSFFNLTILPDDNNLTEIINDSSK